MDSECGRYVPAFTRRDMLRYSANSFGLLALAGLASESARAEAARNPLAPRAPHHPPRAKRIIFLWMQGGPSQVDTFDPKPRLQRDDGKPYSGQIPRFVFAPDGLTGRCMGSPWKFAKHGQSGLDVSELFPHVAGCVDDLCVIRSMQTDSFNHLGANLHLHTGSDTFARPSIGSWLTYGLGSENQNLPGFITICASLAQGGVRNWGSAFLPAVYQGTPIGISGTPARNTALRYVRNPETPLAMQRRQLDLLQEMNAEHLQSSGPDSVLEARINSFELAFRMQTEAPELTDLSGESRETRRLYGIDENPTEDFGRQCLLARRFAERGVRFIQCTSAGNWDQHTRIRADHPVHARAVDKPIAGLLRDLKARGLLEDTLVWWGGEFGRTPTVHVNVGGTGRDHDPLGFTMWLAGGGVKPGMTYGTTDEFGYFAVENKVHMHDMHATILHLMGIDHERLTYRYAGRDFRLTDVHGQVVSGIFA